MANDHYQLLDFGGGHKLESLAGYRIRRPSPAAADARRSNPDQWQQIDASYHDADKRWQIARPWPSELTVHCGRFQMPVRPTPYGHIGLFPEQQANWDWLSSFVSSPSVSQPDARPDALNLFGYTGASTLALVVAGYRVAHVDAAKPNVNAVRLAASCNHLADPPIRYLVDDAPKFAAREVRRGRRYHTIVLDPPAYGHGPTGKAWRLERDLWPLLDDCMRLLDPGNFRLLVTGHSPEVTQDDVATYLKSAGFVDSDEDGLLLSAGRSQLKDLSGRRLDAGFFVRLARFSEPTHR